MAEGANPAVAHDRQAPRAGCHGPQPVGGIGQAVFVQAAGKPKPRRNGDQRRGQRRQRQAFKDNQHAGDEQSDEKTRQRRQS
jgi:hypothetical protein